MASTSGKRCTLSIQQKLEILEALKSKKAEDVAKDFNIGYSTVKKIRQNEEEIRKIVMNNGNLSRKRKRESPNEEIGEALIVWFNQMRAQNATIHGPLMMEKARQLAITLEHQDFEPSHGWLERLKVRLKERSGYKSHFSIPRLRSYKRTGLYIYIYDLRR